MALWGPHKMVSNAGKSEIWEALFSRPFCQCCTKSV